MNYSKADARMTQGMAILCMVILHLFCRVGSDVLGTPLIWLDQTTPLVYWFGFFAEICVPLYSLCAGYAQQLLWETGKSGLRARTGRILRLLKNYWIVVVLFSLLSLVLGNGDAIPGSPVTFLKSLLLLHSYNGAWWYLNTYVILLALPPALLLLPVHKLKLVPGLIVCACTHVLWYLLGKFGLLPATPSSAFLRFVHKEFVNLMGVLPYIWAGGLLCRYRVVEQLRCRFSGTVPGQWQHPLLLTAAVCLFLAANLVHKAVLMGFVAMAVFLLFNLWKKGPRTEKAMLFLGKHSTNIWLVHMFFYSGFLRTPVLVVRYPIPMLAVLLILSVCSSYLIMQVDRLLRFPTPAIRGASDTK